MSHLIVRSTELEAEDGEKVLTLEKDTAFEAVAEVNGMREGGLAENIVDP